jgi:hypothetical protein
MYHSSQKLLSCSSLIQECVSCFQQNLKGGEML